MLSRRGLRTDRRRTRGVERHSITANYTVVVAQLCRYHVFVLDAARDVDIACLKDPEAWIGLMNDASSPADITVKDGGTTVGTLTPGDASEFTPGSTGVIEPL